MQSVINNYSPLNSEQVYGFTAQYFKIEFVLIFS